MKKLILLSMVFLLPSCVAFANMHTPAQDITVNASNFTKNLNSTDTDVQTALATIDQMAGGGGGGIPYPSCSGVVTMGVSAWGSCFTNNSGNWNTAYGWGNWASNFGTASGTIAQGNDSRINNGQTAYGWGNPSGVYLPVGGTAANSAELNGQVASYYYPASNPNSYTTLAAVAGVGYVTGTPWTGMGYLTSSTIPWGNLTITNGTGVNWTSFYPASNPSSFQTLSQVASSISTALSGYATQAWVNLQGFLTGVSHDISLIGSGTVGSNLGVNFTDLTTIYPNIVGNWTDLDLLSTAQTIRGTKTFTQTINGNISGTASNLSGTPALPNGTTATTQSQADGSTKLATTAYVDTGLSGKQATGSYLTAVTADSPLSGSGTSGSHLVISTAGTWAGNAATATSATSATTAGTVTTAAQPNITSTGTLTSLLVSGNVGIGSSNPGQALDVVGTVRILGASAGMFVGTPLSLASYPSTWGSFVGTSGSQNYGQVIVQDLNSNGQGGLVVGGDNMTNTTHYSQIYMNGSGTAVNRGVTNINFANPNALSIYNTDAETDIGTGQVTAGTPAGNINFYVDQHATPTMTITNGNVGIGSTNPGQKLDVNGSVRVNNLFGFGSVYNNSNIGIGTATINYLTGNIQNVGIGTSTGAYMSWTAPSSPTIVRLKIKQDATGSRPLPSTVNIANLHWCGNAAPTLTTTANAWDWISCMYDGTNYDCCATLNFQ
jgi:hypothetical protein